MTDQAWVDVSVLQELDLCHAKIRELVSAGKVPPVLAMQCYRTLLLGFERTIANTESMAMLFVNTTDTKGVRANMQTLCKHRGIWLLENIEFSVRASNGLYRAGIRNLYQLVTLTEAELLRKKNFGKRTLDEVRNFLQKYELRLGMTDQQIVGWCLQQK
ncbi:hypothetical protein IT407_02800 [Candidatus Uhrbacteria bacterium]|nr:hypothetical protein [Candidatus Uhrbacteria bacterium]